MCLCSALVIFLVVPMQNFVTGAQEQSRCI
uniref:Uncharacterized protein n=1 Tax=Anguilla anguilla TaxID=7936 RepID=A0A0E9UQR0_ANGAN